MEYYKDKNGVIFADPVDKKGLKELDSPLNTDGSVLPLHKNIGTLKKDENGNLYSFYKEDGSPNFDKIKKESDSVKAAEAQEYLKNTDYKVIKALELGVSMDELYPSESKIREEKRKIIRDFLGK